MADRDELTPALTGTWNKRLAEHGFRRVGRRDLQRLSNGIVQLFHFHISAWGARDFCVEVTAFTVCGHETPVLEPGFRLRSAGGNELWLPSKSAEEAAKSAETAWKAAETQAIPWLQRNSTLDGHLQILRGENWGSRHHLHFQIGVVEAMLGRREDAIGNLTTACRLYAEDGRSWCPAYSAKAEALIEALGQTKESALLEQWHSENLGVHRVRGNSLRRSRPISSA